MQIRAEGYEGVALVIIIGDLLYDPGRYIKKHVHFSNLYLRNKKRVPCLYRVIQTRVEV